jgi:hypothetical protein
MKPAYLSVKCLVVKCLVVKCLAAAGMATVIHAQGFYWNTARARSMALGGVYLPSEAG